jgi:hypothetical protein
LPSSSGPIERVGDRDQGNHEHGTALNRRAALVASAFERATEPEMSARGRPSCASGCHDPVISRHPFRAVNLISDPIHGYVELTKRLDRGESAAAELPDEDVAEEDLLDTAWLQRMRRISQLQSARWVFPTAEHSRFTHGLGVMHEAGRWARSLYPSLRSALLTAGEPVPTEGLAVETLRMAGLLHDVGHGPFAHFFDDHVLSTFESPPDPRRPDGSADPRGLSQRRTRPDPPGLHGATRRADAPGDDSSSSRPVPADHKPAVPSMPRGCAGSSRSCRACSPSTISTTCGATRT